MSNIYIQEPLTSGKVLLQTTVGDIDVELWSKEAPKACRNFIQLCMEGYYNGTIFHRVIKGFIVQGGDPEGSGFGGQSIYGEHFKNEVHSRLRFVRRGLVAMANSGKEDNGSQFFFTLGACPELQNKHTIFGKVTGNTLYNMLKLGECLVDSDDRPIYPHKILSCTILDNPFQDITPRILQKEKVVTQEKIVEKRKKNYSLLSFGEEAEEDEAEADAVVKEFRGKSKSSHDLAKDPDLSSIPAVTTENALNVQPPDSALLESVRKKLKKENEGNKILQTHMKPESAVPNKGKESDVDLKRKEIKKEIKELKKELSKQKVKQEVEQKKTNDGNEKDGEGSFFAEYNKQIEDFVKKKSLIAPKGEEREKQTLAILSKFQNKLQAAKEDFDHDEIKCTVGAKEKGYSEVESDDADGKWLSHKLCFDEEVVVIAKDVNLPSADRYDITDPRNPINQRRRHADQKGNKSKR